MMFPYTRQMRSHRPRGVYSGPLLEPWPRWVVATMTVVVIGVLAFLGWWAYSTDRSYEASYAQYHQRWDAKTNRPAAATVSRGATEPIPVSITSVDGYWSNCLHACTTQSIPHYPVIFSLWVLQFNSKGCFVVHPSNRVHQVSAALVRAAGAHYTLSLASDGTSFTICRTPNDGAGKSDRLVVWSDDRNAAR